MNSRLVVVAGSVMNEVIHVTTAGTRVRQECPGPGEAGNAANDQAMRMIGDALARAETMLVEAVTHGSEMAFALWRVAGTELDRAEGLQGTDIEEASGDLAVTTRRLRAEH